MDRNVFVGLDWAEKHHDIFIEDDDGARVASARLAEGIEGVARFHQIVSGLADHPSQVVIATETGRGTVHRCTGRGRLPGAGRQPDVDLALPRTPLDLGAKSVSGDAKVLADLARTDRHNHRPIAGDSDLAAAVKTLAWGHQSLIWTRQRQTNQLRSTLREFFPAALEAFTDLAHPDAFTVGKPALRKLVGVAA